MADLKNTTDLDSGTYIENVIWNYYFYLIGSDWKS